MLEPSNVKRHSQIINLIETGKATENEHHIDKTLVWFTALC